MSLKRAPHEAIAITGLGMVSCQGIGRDATWRGIIERRDAAQAWSGELPPHLAALRVAECPELPCPANFRRRLWTSLSRGQQMACIAADEALDMAALPRRLPEIPCGCFVSTSVCGMDRTEQFYANYRLDNARTPLENLKRVHPFELTKLLVKRHGLRGPQYMNLTTCVGSSAAIGAAVDAIRAGLVPMAIAGGVDALCQLLISGFTSLRLVSTAGCRPFAHHRDGILPGEGGAIVVLESIRSARARGAQIIGYLRGFGATCDGFHLTKPEPDGRQAYRAICEALKDADVPISAIDYINAHGTGTRDNDATEAGIYRRLFEGLPMPPISSTKHLTGHTFAASGAIELGIALMAMQACIIPPNACVVQDPAHAIHLAAAPLSQKINTVLHCNFAFGGNNTAMIVSALAGANP